MHVVNQSGSGGGDAYRVRTCSPRARIDGPNIIADAALYLSLLSLPGVNPTALWALTWMAAVCEYAGVLGVMVGASRRYDGPMGKSDRAFVIGLIGVLLAPGWIDGAIVGWIAWAAAAFCVLTGWRRVRQGLAEIG